MASASRAVNDVGKPVHMILAVGRDGEFGNKGRLPWDRLDQDMAHFAQTTTATRDPGLRNMVVMGRRTWESIPARLRPLKGRLNAVVSTTMAAASEADLLVADCLERALRHADEDASVESIVAIGGPALLEQLLRELPWRCHTLFLTVVDANFEADVRLQLRPYLRLFSQPDDSPAAHQDAATGVSYTISALANPRFGQQPRHEEHQYLDLIREILAEGSKREDRTGVGTLALFGRTMRFSLRGGRFPLLTTKQTFFRGVAEELIWFVRGCTNAKLLAAKKVHIWDANGSREFLDSRGLSHREVGDLGPVYGFQWRHFGAKYVDMQTDYSGQGFDQLADCIHKIKTNPTDRRIIMSAWNPADLHLMALPPCHMFCQFFVAEGELSCLMYQRSADMGLGVPFNIASYALLTCMVAQVCGLKPGEFIHSLGDTHIYSNHVDALNVQLSRQPFPFPKLVLDPLVTNIDDFEYQHIKLIDYQSHPRIAMEMAL